jgi:penicillin-binding protein 1A
LRAAVLSAAILLVGGGAATLWLVGTLPDLEGLEPAPRAGEVVLLDRHGRTIARRGEVSAEAITADALPEGLVEAVLAVEDRRFYSHFGVDVLGSGRALLANIRADAWCRAAPPSPSSWPRTSF